MKNNMSCKNDINKVLSIPRGGFSVGIKSSSTNEWIWMKHFIHWIDYEICQGCGSSEHNNKCSYCGRARKILLKS